MKLTLVPDKPIAQKVSQNASYGRGRLSVIPAEIPPDTVVECNARSAYPPELLSKYKLPKASGSTWWVNPNNGPHCVTCNRAGSPNFFAENGRCYYCENGLT